MLRRLVFVSLHHRGVVVALGCALTLYGIYSAKHAKYDVYPEFAPPQVVVQTEAPGLSPEQVEQLVTRPVEMALNGVANLVSIRSQSIQGLSVVTVIFQEGTDVYNARQLSSERLMPLAGQLPQGVQPPVLAPPTGATGLVLVLGLTSEKRSLMDLRDFAEWTMRPRLLGVPGVAKVNIFGGEVRQLQVQIDPARLAAYDLSPGDVVAAARAATGIRGAGFIETTNQRLVLQTEGQSLTPAQIGEIAINSAAGNPVRLKDVAKIAEAAEPKIGDATVGGRRGVLVLVSSQFGGNTLDVTTAAESALEEMKPAIRAAEITLHPALFRPANFIVTAISNIRFSLLLGAVLVAAVLLLFLYNLRTAFITLTAIPLSLLVAVVILQRMGQSLNTLTLGGLAIAIGEVVDDAIIDVENIYRRLRENRGGSRFRVILSASLEVRGAVVYATLIVALVFVPVLTMTGVMGSLFSPLAMAYILAILASLAVALTVTPALCYFLLGRETAAVEEPRYIAVLKARYFTLLAALTRRPKSLLAASLLLCALAAALIPYFGGEFLPELREGHYIVHMAALPGTSLDESARLGALVSRELLKSRKVVSVAQQIGRAEVADDTWGTHYSEVHVDLQPLKGREAETVEAELRKTLEAFPGLSFAVKPFLTERMEEVISGTPAQVAVKVFGGDHETLDKKAAEIASVLAQIRGAVDAKVESAPGTPRITARLRPERLKQLGYQPLQVLDSVQTAYQGTVAGQTYQGNRVVDLAVILDPRFRETPEAVASLLVRNQEGVRVPLRQLAEVAQSSGRYMIVHDGARRLQTVSCNVRGRDLTSFVEEAKQAVQARVRFPAGTYAAFSGSSEARAQAQRELLLFSLLAGTGIVLLLFVAFRSTPNTLLVLVNLPFALVGGVFAVALTGATMTVGSLVGFVTLFGITTRNSIMMISHFDHLVTREGAEWGFATALRGASERLTPVLMTAVVTALGLLPLALGSGDPGREIEGPMAQVILGGLMTSTALNLLALPALALRFGRFGKPRATEPSRA